MTGGYVTPHNAEAIEAFFGPYQHSDHVKLHQVHARVLDMERVNQEIRELVESGKLFPVVFK